MKLVMIHGIGQTKHLNDPIGGEALEALWLASLMNGKADAAKLAAANPAMAYYGDILAEGKGAFALTSLIDNGRRQRFFMDVLADLNQSIKSSVLGEIQSFLANPPKAAFLGGSQLQEAIREGGFTRLFELIDEVYDYLTKDNLRRRIDEQCNRAFDSGANTVLAHSLGTIVAFRLLHKRARAGLPGVRRLITFGSPLSIRPVRDLMVSGQSWDYPPGLGDWFNVYDTRDPVTLGTSFDAPAGSAGRIHHATVTNNTLLHHQHPEYLDKQEVVAPLMEVL